MSWMDVITGTVMSTGVLAMVVWCGKERSESCRSSEPGKDLPRSLLHIRVEAVPVCVHRHDGGELLHLDMPHRFRNAEFKEIDAVDARDAFRIVLCRAADGIEVDRAVLFEGGKGLRPHASLSYHCAE